MPEDHELLTKNSYRYRECCNGDQEKCCVYDFHHGSNFTIGTCDKILGEESHGRKCGIESEGAAKVNGIGDPEQKNEHVQNISDSAP